ncbi:hypothetical protein KBD61_06250 [Patescibacteria group bacterium]|nr:hypothetical protein [Patescibacteria group bacterium]MBP9710588.1 hypothetical protein [Patescibacteria group bacterium]
MSGSEQGIFAGAALNCEAQLTPRLTLGGAATVYHAFAPSFAPSTDIYVTTTISLGRQWILGVWAGVGVRWAADENSPSLRQFIFVTRAGLAPNFSLFMMEGLSDRWIFMRTRVGIKAPTNFGSIVTGVEFTWNNIIENADRPTPGIYTLLFF